MKILILALVAFSAFAKLPDFSTYRSHKYSPSQRLISAITKEGKLEIWNNVSNKKIMDVSGS